MRFQKTRLSTQLLAAFGALAFAGAHAQEAASETQRVEVTGSSIKRIAAESALPVQIISAEEIKKSGVSTVTDLVQNLPAMQGFTTNSQSVNGGGGGTTTASLHDLGAAYTLVLLNGRRLAPFNTGSEVNLNTIPLAAIERVEVLTDGASALYGSDAIAGVVNFITKKDSTDGLFTGTAYIPQHKGGGSGTVSLSKGIGDLDKDHFNVLLSASFDKQQKLDASQRPFSKSGILTFHDQFGDEEVDLISSNSVPANVAAKLSDGSTVSFNPSLMANGSCPPSHVQGGNRCFFDYPSTVEAIPASTRYSLFGAARFVINDKASLFSELGFSRFYSDPRYAPPAQPGLVVPTALITADIDPYLAALGHPGATATSATMNLRLFDAGGRQDRYKQDSIHAVLGGDFTLGAVDLTASYTHSQNKITDTAEGGYSDKIAFYDLINSGAWDPLMDGAGTSVATVAPIVLHQVLDTSKSGIDVLSAHGSMSSLAKMDGGDLGLGFGLDFMHQTYKDDPSAILQGTNALQPDYTDAIVGGGGGTLPFDSKRNSIGLYSELVMPLSKQVELSASGRFDSYGAVSNSENFDSNGNPIGNATQGKKSSSATYKLSARIQPTKDFLLRASYGTGFRAPTLANITTPLQAFGSTGFHNCPFQPSDPQYSWCGATPTVAQEYNIQTGGNPASDAGGLKPEHSKQWTIGFRVEPSSTVSVGLDLWTVTLRDQIGSVTEDTAFGDGATTTKYPYLFKFVPDPISGTPTLTFLSVPINTGKAFYQGLDLDGEAKFNTGIGKLTTSLRGTYMLRADYQTPGIPGYINSMNKVGVDSQVTFQWLLTATASLQTGPVTNTLVAHFTPGYKDDYTDYCWADVCDADAPNRHVGNYNVFDWQTKYDMTKSFSATFGLKNMFDRKPPFSLIDQPGTGNARGFDGRYTDPIGRQFYIGASYKF